MDLQGNDYYTYIFSCSISVLFDDVVRLKKQTIKFRSHLKYFGNCQDGDEPFLKFKDLRVYDRILQVKELEILSYPYSVKCDVTMHISERYKSLEKDLLYSINQKDIEEYISLLVISAGGSIISIADLIMLLNRISKSILLKLKNLFMKINLKNHLFSNCL